jgi:hypothetical protein
VRFAELAGSGISVLQNAIGSGSAEEFGSQPFPCSSRIKKLT